MAWTEGGWLFGLFVFVSFNGPARQLEKGEAMREGEEGGGEWGGLVLGHCHIIHYGQNRNMPRILLLDLHSSGQKFLLYISTFCHRING